MSNVLNITLNKFYVKDNPELAFKYYNRAHELNKKNLAYYYGCIVSLIALKEYDVKLWFVSFTRLRTILTSGQKALHELKTIQDSFPVEPVTYILLGIVHDKKKDTTNALLNLTKAQDMKDAPKSILKGLIGIPCSIFFMLHQPFF